MWPGSDISVRYAQRVGANQFLELKLQFSKANDRWSPRYIKRPERYTRDLTRLRLEVQGPLAEGLALDLQYDNELLARNTDWTRVGIHDNAPITNHNLSVSGATDQLNYYVGGGLENSEGAEANNAARFEGPGTFAGETLRGHLHEMAGDPHRMQIVVNAEAIEAPIAMAQPLVLAINEMVVNALRHVPHFGPTIMPSTSAANSAR